MQCSEIFLFVAVNQVASGEIDPVAANAFPLGRDPPTGIVNFCERLTASVPSSISTASPTDQILTLVGETQPVVVPIRAETLSGLFGFTQVGIGEVPIPGPRCG